MELPEQDKAFKKLKLIQLIWTSEFNEFNDDANCKVYVKQLSVIELLPQDLPRSSNHWKTHVEGAG